MQAYGIGGRRVYNGNLWAGELEDPVAAQSKKLEAAEKDGSRGYSTSLRLKAWYVPVVSLVMILCWNAEEMSLMFTGDTCRRCTHSSRVELFTCVPTPSFFLFYFILATSLLDGATRNQGGFSILILLAYMPVISQNTPQTYLEV